MYILIGHNSNALAKIQLGATVYQVLYLYKLPGSKSTFHQYIHVLKITLQYFLLSIIHRKYRIMTLLTALLLSER